MKKTISLLLSLLAFSAIASKPVYLDPAQPADKRVKDLMSRMTLEDKVAQMCQYVGPEHMRIFEKGMSAEKIRSERKGIYKGLYHTDIEQMVVDGKVGSFLHVVTAVEANALQRLAKKSPLGIPLLIGIDAAHGNGMSSGATVYPSPISMASSWDDSLVYEISRQTASEMRVMGAHWAYSPNLDIGRDARWGRFGETYGEDTYLITRMGVATIKGMQQGDFTGPDKVIACAKHLVGGGDPVNGSNVSASDISERTLREVHYPPYLPAIQDAGVFTIMVAHNEINGIPCHNNSFLMQDLLRKEMGFKGFVVSDWVDIERLANGHKVVKDTTEAFISSVVAGIDMHMHGPGFLETITEAVKQGQMDKKRVEWACSKILEAKFRLGLFEQPFTDEATQKERLFTPVHRQTALEGARKGIILLKNDSILPIDTRKVKRIFLTGLNADNHNMLGDWTLRQPDENVITVRQGLEKLGADKGVKVDYFRIGDYPRLDKDYDLADEAAKASAGADLAVIAVGETSLRYLNNRTCGENLDRANINLLGSQLKLVQAIKATGIPVVVVFVTGRPLSEPWIEENVEGVVMAWEPGAMGGQALAEILFGDVNPSAKLTATVPRHVGQIKIYYNVKPLHYFRPHRDIPLGPLYHFGYGLSYSKFEYSNLKLSSASIGKGGKVNVSVDVTNASDRPGDEVVQLYIRDNVSSVTRPVMELKGYERLSIPARATRTVTFSIDTYMLSFLDRDMKLVTEKGDFTIMVGSSSRDKDLLKATLTMTAEERF